MKRPFMMAAWLLVGIMALGLALGYTAAIPEGYGSSADLQDGQSLILKGRVYRKNDQNFYLDSISIIQNAANPQQTIHLQENLICERGTLEQELPMGSYVVLEGTFQRFSQATNPGEFDSAGYYSGLGIGGKLTHIILRERGQHYHWGQETLYQLKVYFKERLYRIFPEEEASLMSTMLLGDKSGLDAQLKDLYQRNGIIHILSISGLHITIIGMSVYKLLRKLGLPLWLSALLGGSLLLLYGFMTGMSISACRAIGMYLIRMLGQMLGRTYDMLTALSLLAAGMVCANPAYLQHAGFLLSFGSVLGIGVLYPALAGKEERGMGWGTKLMRALQAGLSITLMTLPIQLWFYYEIPVYSVLLNLLVLPCMGVVIPVGLIAMLIPGLGILGTIDCAILWGYERLCIYFDRLPFHTWNPGRPGLWQILLYYLLLAALMWWWRNPGGVRIPGFLQAVSNHEALDKQRGVSKQGSMSKQWTEGKQKPLGQERRSWCYRFLQIISLTALVLLLAVRLPEKTSVTFLDVGQGDGICIRTQGGEVYLVDCGSTGRSKVGEYVLIPYLKYYGIGRIDAIFLSHSDADHCNGILELLTLGAGEGIAIERIILPDIAKEQKQEEWGAVLEAVAGSSQSTPISVSYIHRGETYEGEDISFHCLHPPADYAQQESNAYSECFYVPELSLLLTGDVEGEGEKLLLEELKRSGVEQVAMLKIAHHGSRNSTPRELLEQIQPQAALISCGSNNRYGHPHADTLSRLEEANCSIWCTKDAGAITVKRKGNGLQLKGYLVR